MPDEDASISMSRWARLIRHEYKSRGTAPKLWSVARGPCFNKNDTRKTTQKEQVLHTCNHSPFLQPALCYKEWWQEWRAQTETNPV